VNFYFTFPSSFPFPRVAGGIRGGALDTTIALRSGRGPPAASSSVSRPLNLEGESPHLVVQVFAWPFNRAPPVPRHDAPSIMPPPQIPWEIQRQIYFSGPL